MQALYTALIYGVEHNTIRGAQLDVHVTYVHVVVCE